ncbi:hypothetical protein [Candidatus Njordibacter sp. Uisw_002]|uniref:hypothetical protein n=1 Tax=Candidatus Njordibacter sp. Uisw_002 TaxID=3230971 RepID=UPI003D514B97
MDFNRLTKSCLLLTLSLYISQSAQAGNIILIKNPSFSCDAQISLYLDDVFNETDNGGYYIDLQDIGTIKSVIKHNSSLYDHYYKIASQGKTATITISDGKGQFIIFDRDLPCLAALSIADNSALAVVSESQQMVQTQIDQVSEAADLQKDNDDISPLAFFSTAIPAPQEVLPKTSNKPLAETESTTYIESNSSNENASSVKQTKRPDSSDSMEMQVKASVVASVGEARLKIDEVESRITMLVAILEYTSNASPTRREKITSTIGSEIEKLRKEKAYMQTFYSKRFSTPIRPNNANLKVSAFRAAETFPKIPYYVPGTDEVGEMLVMPQVSDVGALYYSFEFMDPSSSYSKVRDTIKVSHESIDFLISGLAKIDSWTDVAQDNNVNRRVEKTASCIPVNACDDKKAGVSSTEVMFQIYEDGSTAGRIQRNKGLYVVGYNMSVESSILLEAYLRYMKEIGSKEFNVGVMTNEEILDLFE